jgi:hypothetical protein
LSRIENYRNTHFPERKLSRGEKVEFDFGNVAGSRPAITLRFSNVPPAFACQQPEEVQATLMTKGCCEPKLVAEQHLKFT